MIRRTLFLLGLVVALAGTHASTGVAQGPDTPVSSGAAAAPALAQGGQAAESPGYMGAAERVGGVTAAAGQPPRTLRAYWHVFIAFAVTWLLLFGYVISLGRRWAALERQVQIQSGAGAR